MVQLARRQVLGGVLGGIAALAARPVRVFAHDGTCDDNDSDDTIAVYPLGSGRDDGPALTAALKQYAGKRPVRLARGLWTLRSTVVLPAGCVLLGQEGVRVVTAIDAATGGGNAGSPVVGNCGFYAAGVPSGIGTTLTEKNEVGTNVLSLNEPLPIGAFFCVGSLANVFQMSTYQVTDVAGTGPYLVTLDRPVLYQFGIDDPANMLIEPAHDIHVDGRGMSMSGNCVRYFEIATGVDCVIENVRFDSTDGSPVGNCASFDCGGIRNVFRGIVAEAGGLPLGSCLALESNEGSRILNCEVASAFVGFTVADCVKCDIIGSRARDTTMGLIIGADGDLLGSRFCRVVGGHYDHNKIGVYIGWGSTDNDLSGFSANDNSQNGVELDGSGAMNRNLLADFEARRNGMHGVKVHANSGMQTFLMKADLSENAGHALWTRSDTFADGVRISDDVLGTRVLIDEPGATLTLRHLSVESRAPGQIAVQNADGTLIVSDSKIHVGASSVGICLSPVRDNGGAKLSSTHIAPADEATGVVGVRQTSGTLTIGKGMKVDACATPWDLAGGTQVSPSSSSDADPTTGSP